MKKPPILDYNSDVDAAYLNLVGYRDQVEKTTVLGKYNNAVIVADFNEKEEIIGIEIVYKR
jgi:uncharacterized protein YuzE